MDIEEWRHVIDYWIQDGRDIKHLDIPRDVADVLGIELPPREETDMNDDATETAQQDAPATTEPADNVSVFIFKKKKIFDGTTCGLQGCSRKLPVEGAYISGLKTTKDSNRRLWYGPACEKCVTRLHPGGMKPDTLAMLAHQRNGKSDLALILDIEVGDIERRLVAASIDEHGKTGNPGALGSVTVQGGGGKWTLDPGASAPKTGDNLAATESTTIPTDHLATTSQGIQGTLTFLGTFHIQTQEDMDNAGGWLQTVKSQWTDLDEMRKVLSKPHRDATAKIQTQFNPVLNQLAQVEGIIKQKISEGHVRAAATQQTALATAQAAHEAGNLQASGQAQQQAAAADVVLPQGVHQRPNIVKYEVVNQAEVPSDLFSWVLDPAKIEVALSLGVRQIPGIRIWEEPSLQARQS